MYSTKQATLGILSDILSQIDEYDIYAYYMGNFDIGKLYNSPLRTDDKNPSFAIFKGRRGNLMFKDHGSGESGNVIKIVKLFKHIYTEKKKKKELLHIIRHTAPLSTRVSTKNYKTHNSVDIGIVRQSFTDIDKEYWKSFAITEATLNKFEVFSIKYFLCNKIVSGVYKDTNPMYAYKVNNKFKIYRPLNSKYTKWRTNLEITDIQGYAQLPDTNNLLIITKSLKDIMVLYEMGYCAVSPSSETTFIPEDILNDLKARFKKILILFDNDETGIKKAQEYSNKYNLIQFVIDSKFNAKDISDAVKLNGFDVIKNWLNTKIEELCVQHL